ncbi:MAG: peptidyl-prolyl cis-trans isomerase [Myxococcales bacterium]|nr:peptidyl-prolyl cis-trans isomerase [Myxococcales bacterium]
MFTKRSLGLVLVSTAAISTAAGFFLGRRFSGASGDAAGDSQSALAAWKGGRVTEQDLRAWLEEKPPLVRGEYVADARKKRELLEELLDVELLAQEARLRKADEKPALRLRVDQVLAEGIRSEELSRQRPPTEAELRAAYEARRSEFERPEQRRVRLIALLASESDTGGRREKQDVAQALLERLKKEMKKDPHAFMTAARERSEHFRSRDSGGDLGLLTQEALAAEVGGQVADAVRQLAPGQPSAVISNPQGFYIAVVEVVRPAASTSFEAARDALSVRLTAEKAASHPRELIARLRSQAAVQIDEERLGALSFSPR